ncbi:hypothetical protein I4U23_010653 [Adineta vaga]|nr:hypothetical protein I4U23_010653 [Adineta vaga]
MQNNELFFSNVEKVKDVNGIQQLVEVLHEEKVAAEEKLRKAQQENSDQQILDDILQEITQIVSKMKFVDDIGVNIAEKKDSAIRGEDNEPVKKKVKTKIDPSLGEGKHFKTSSDFVLTEWDDDFIIIGIKYIFEHYVLFQFHIFNMLDNQSIYEVVVEMDTSAKGFQIVHSDSCSEIHYGVYGQANTYVRLAESSSNVTGTLSCKMKYKIDDNDPDLDEYDEAEKYFDEFKFKDIEVTINDHLQEKYQRDCLTLWKKIGEKNEFKYFSTLSITTIGECMNQIINLMGMTLCEKSAKVNEEETIHTIYLGGIYRNGHDVLVQVQLKPGGRSAVLPTTTTTTTTTEMQLTIRSTDSSVAQVIGSAIKY